MSSKSQEAVQRVRSYGNAHVAVETTTDDSKRTTLRVVRERGKKVIVGMKVPVAICTAKLWSAKLEEMDAARLSDPLNVAYDWIIHTGPETVAVTQQRADPRANKLLGLLMRPGPAINAAFRKMLFCWASG